MVQHSDLIIGLALIVTILFSLSVHEFAHAFVANLFGDPTAKNEGRLSLNPFTHWDSVGTTLLVGSLALRAFIGVNLPAFGWGKPVPVNDSNFDNPKLSGIQTALAGPMSNFVLAAILGLIIRFVHMGEIPTTVLFEAVYVNIFLMFFNLLPIPPLDGSSVLRLVISDRAYYSLASNPMFLFGGLFVIFFFLADWLGVASFYLTRLLIGG